LSNNCEHFSEWCVHGCHRSLQAERFLAPLQAVSHALRSAMRWLKMPRLGDSGSPKLAMDWAAGVLRGSAGSLIREMAADSQRS